MPTTENRCPTVQEIYTFIDAFAPFSTQADFDNCGLLVGDRDAAVTGLLAALDVTDAVLDEAEALGANLILTHHPLMLHGRRNLLAEDREGHRLEQAAAVYACGEPCGKRRVLHRDGPYRWQGFEC